VLSNGRLRFGAGQGWSQDEYVAAGIPWEKHSKRFEEALQVLTAIWTTDPVQFEGEFYSVPRSIIGPKPVQKPRPPIYLGAFSPSAVARAARYADGWLAVAYPLADIAGMFATVRAAAEEAGRDPDELELIVRANIRLTEQPLGDKRSTFAGTAEQVAADVSAAHDIGTAELIMDATFDPAVESADDFVERMEVLTRLAREAAGVRA
jgi:alkanesulfonate monooxygenase SsuD/methylene tetrahydromethanopterin reductase-like flavin-dependent oxidoreductase (luciferase family)